MRRRLIRANPDWGTFWPVIVGHFLLVFGYFRRVVYATARMIGPSGSWTLIWAVLSGWARKDFVAIYRLRAFLIDWGL
jgi:hypothetical protein